MKNVSSSWKVVENSVISIIANSRILKLISEFVLTVQLPQKRATQGSTCERAARQESFVIFLIAPLKQECYESENVQ